MDMRVAGQAARDGGRGRGGRFAFASAWHVQVAVRSGQPVFADFHVAWAAVRGFHAPGMRGDCTLLAWVLMPDHVQWLLGAGIGTPLEAAVARMKSAAGVQVNRTLARAGALWAPAFQDRPLGQDEDLRAVAAHLVASPVRAGLVDCPGNYPFWDSAWA